ncbi:UNVERIFIED_CONTAM: hypothetical protein Slati_0896200 [Sesamum latifolium]|uniref:Transposase n=1 Tax=Sesamum latifolium TaxID=2727402 RepID=A0AAW2XPQ9_9LAMI
MHRLSDFGPLHAAIIRYKSIPQSQKNFWFEELKRVYWWDCPDKPMQSIFNSYAPSWLSKTFLEARMAGTQPNWLRDDIWHELQVYWDTDEFKAKSVKNKANRVASPAKANTIYRGGSSSVGMHNKKLVRGPTWLSAYRMEVFANCYKKKADGTWSGKRAKEVVKTYQKLLEERLSAHVGGGGLTDGIASIVQEDQLWAEAAGGRKRGRAFGMGSDALMSDAAQPWTTEARPSSSTVAPSPNDTKLDKIMLVLSALCAKMGMPQMFLRCSQPLMSQSKEQRNRQPRMLLTLSCQTSQKH